MLHWQQQQQQQPPPPSQYEQAMPPSTQTRASHVGPSSTHPLPSEFDVHPEALCALDARIKADFDNELWPLYFPGLCVCLCPCTEACACVGVCVCVLPRSVCQSVCGGVGGVVGVC